MRSWYKCEYCKYEGRNRGYFSNHVKWEHKIFWSFEDYGGSDSEDEWDDQELRETCERNEKPGKKPGEKPCKKTGEKPGEKPGKKPCKKTDEKTCESNCL